MWAEQQSKIGSDLIVSFLFLFFSFNFIFISFRFLICFLISISNLLNTNVAILILFYIFLQKQAFIHSFIHSIEIKITQI